MLQRQGSRRSRQREKPADDNTALAPGPVDRRPRGGAHSGRLDLEGHQELRRRSPTRRRTRRRHTRRRSAASSSACSALRGAARAPCSISIAGLDQPTTGRVDVGPGAPVSCSRRRRSFPVAHGPRQRRDRAQARGRPATNGARAAQLLDMVHLGDFAKRRPHELRAACASAVALARALAQDADVLLMDEPFGASTR